MSTDFKLTEEEINKTILRSPYSLADSPAQRGLGAGQIKKYFYDFIRYFAQCINLHLGDITLSTQALEEACQELSLEMSSHNASVSAHPHLRIQIDGARSRADEAYFLARNIDLSPYATKEALLAEGEENSRVHEEIRALIELAKEKASSAYNLASGKSRVHPVLNVQGMYDKLQNELDSVNVGDVFIIAEPLVPEFILYSKENEPLGEDFFVDTMYENGVEYKAGNMYYLYREGVRILALESGIDTSKLTTKEELSSKASELLAILDEKTAPLVTKEELAEQESERDEEIASLATKDELVAHNQSEEAHSDIRELIDKNKALLLSHGSNRVYVQWSTGNMYHFLQKYYTNAGLLEADEYPVCTGDFIFVVENGLQIFKVSSVDPSATVIPNLSAFLDYQWENGTVYYVEPLRVYLTVFGSQIDVNDILSSETLSSKQDKKKYELIGEYTVEPEKDENGEVILDEGGNPVFPEVFKISGFELTDFYINAKMAYASTSAKTKLFANELALFGSLGISGMKEDGTLRSWECFYNSYGEGAGGIVSFLAGTIDASAAMPNSSIFNSNTVFVPPTKTGFDNITSISIQAVGSAFVEGSKIKLYGVKK